MSWVRGGECNRCGDCCRTGDPFAGELGEAEVTGACALFTWTADGDLTLGTCKVRVDPSIKDTNVGIKNYHENACSRWPTIPDQVESYPNCSYTFEWVEP